MTFLVGESNTLCEEVVAIEDQTLENVEVFSASIRTDDISVQPYFPAIFVVFDNDCKFLHRICNFLVQVVASTCGYT